MYEVAKNWTSKEGRFFGGGGSKVETCMEGFLSFQEESSAQISFKKL
jgi:hypothetical protein